MRFLVLVVLVAAAAAATLPGAAACSPAVLPVSAYVAPCPLGPDAAGVAAGAWVPDSPTSVFLAAAACSPYEAALAGAPLEGCAAVVARAQVCLHVGCTTVSERIPLLP